MKLVKMIQEYGSLAITLLIIVLLGALMTVSLGIADDWRDPKMWIEMGFNYLLQIVMIATWIPEGTKRGANDEAYKTNRECANAKMKMAASADHYPQLKEFCQNATEENRVAWICKKVRRLGINYQNWEFDEYKKEFSAKLQDRVSKIEKKSYKHVEEIKATEIVTNSQIALVYDTKDHTGRAATIKVTAKIVLSSVMCSIGAFIVIDEVQFAFAAVIKLFYWIMVMGLSIFFGIRTGYKLMTVNKNDYYRRMIVFLNHFEEWKQQAHCEQEKAPEN